MAIEQDHQQHKFFDYNAVADRAMRAMLRKKAEYGKAILRRTAQGIWDMGELLSEVKAALPYGDFGTWIEAEFDMSHMSATRYMNVFLSFPDLPQMLKNSTFKIPSSILYELSKPSVSDDDREAAIGLIQSGDIKTVSDVKGAIAPPKSPNEMPQARSLEEGSAEEENVDANSVSLNGETPSDPADNYDAEERAAMQEEGSQTGSTSGGSSGSTSGSSSSGSQTDTAPKPSVHERIEALPLAQALAKYKHGGRLFRNQAEIYYEQEYALKAARRSLAAIRYTTGPITDAIKNLAAIPEPEKWEGCPACKGSLRFGDNADPCPRCNCGFTTHVGEGVSADVVHRFAEEFIAEQSTEQAAIEQSAE